MRNDPKGNGRGAIPFHKTVKECSPTGPHRPPHVVRPAVPRPFQWSISVAGREWSKKRERTPAPRRADPAVNRIPNTFALARPIIFLTTSGGEWHYSTDVGLRSDQLQTRHTN